MHTLYRLTEPPFALTPDPKFWYWSPTHRQVLQLFVRSQQRSPGLLVITGARGTGKTAFLQAFATLSAPRTHLVSLPYPASSTEDLYVLLAQQMGLDRATQRLSTPRSQIDAWLRQRLQHRDKIIVLLDNAHEWSERLLADLEVFTRLGTPTSKVFHLILAGPLSLPDTLSASRLASLRARITAMGVLSPFDLHATQAYIQHRLTIAGGPKASLFTSAAVDVIYRATHGVPRAINQLCSQALLAGGAAHMSRIDAALVQHVATRMGLLTPASSPLPTETPQGTTPASPQPTVSHMDGLNTARQDRGRTARRRMARRTRLLLPLGLVLLMGGSVLRSGGGLQERGTVMRAAPGAVDRQLPATAEPLLPSGRARAVEADIGAREALAQEGASSSQATPHAPVRPTPLRTTPALPNLHAARAASAPSRATLHRPPPSEDTRRLAPMARVPLHDPAQPHTQRGFTAAPRLPTHADPVVHDTSDALEPLAPRRPAPLVQDAALLGAALRPSEATDARFRGHASETAETTQPRLPLAPPTAVPERSAALPRSPAPPPREAPRLTPRGSTTAEGLARPVPPASIQGRTVEIHTELAQTSVLINGAYIGPSPVVLHLPLGVYTMVIARPGYTPMTWKMQVDPHGIALHMTKAGGGSWPPHYTPRVVAH